MYSFLTELAGYFAFIFLAISLWVTNDIKFRWVNSLGCLSFIIYGIIINAYPIVLTNTVLLAINIFFIIKIYRRKEFFDLAVFKTDGVLIKKFLSFYKDDINSYFPGFNLNGCEDDLKFVVLRDIVIANLFVATVDKDGNAFVKLNYTVAKYRDYKVGRFLFEEGTMFLKDNGVKKIVYTTISNKGHQKFIKAMGFTQELYNNTNCFVKQIE